MRTDVEEAAMERRMERTVRIPIDGVALDADLRIPAHARGVVIFAHENGSDRQSPRYRLVADELERAGFATLCVDLLTPAEHEEDARCGSIRFDIDLLAARLGAATDWAIHDSRLWSLPVGYYGASTGAAAAMLAAVRRPGVIKAIVSRGGRPDLAPSALGKLRCPTLLIVGGEDVPMLELNEDSVRTLGAHGTLRIIPEATHLFEEPGALEDVATLTRNWFIQYLAHRREPIGQAAW